MESTVDMEVLEAVSNRVWKELKLHVSDSAWDLIRNEVVLTSLTINMWPVRDTIYDTISGDD